MSNEELKVMFVSSEAAPYAKSGGLGDVVGSLPKALRDQNVDARIIIPKYSSIPQTDLEGLTRLESWSVKLGWRNQNAAVSQINSPVPTYLIENDYYFWRDGLYGYDDDFERFSFFTKSAIEALGHIDFQPDIIHFNDWQTAPGCLYISDIYKKFLFYNDVKTLYTIHNLQFQGIFGPEVLNAMDLPGYYYASDKLEHFGKVNFMKSALLYADAISTVSETYAREIQTGPYGCGLDGLLRQRSQDLYGIINGIDNEKHDPATDPAVFANYNLDSLDKKKENKRALQKKLDLPEKDVPMFSIISRLTDQKGLDLIAVCLNELMSMDIQLVVLGTGEGRYEQLFRSASWQYPDKISANIYFDETLAQQIYAAADLFLMPSLFEPCGLGQMFAMRFGTIPIVRKVGGLNDTVCHYDAGTQKGNGFLFEDYVASGLMWAIQQALETYRDPCHWEKITYNAMSCDFSWAHSAEKYKQLYRTLKLKGHE